MVSDRLDDSNREVKMTTGKSLEHLVTPVMPGIGPIEIRPRISLFNPPADEPLDAWPVCLCEPCSKRLIALDWTPAPPADNDAANCGICDECDG